VRPYDGAAARAYWRVLVQAHRVLQLFRSGFIGKCSPVHLFWGSFDLAVTRFSGRDAPMHLGGMPNVPNAVAREAGAAFYSYTYPIPSGFAAARIQPASAFFDESLGEFILPYDSVQASADPDGDLMAFLQSTYAAAADLAGWDRAPGATAGMPRSPARGSLIALRYAIILPSLPES
jgi:hypothetical protein